MKKKDNRIFDPKQAVLDILIALEYGTKKEETEILNTLLGDSSRNAEEINLAADAVLKSPGFESFLFKLFEEIKPFSQMLIEIYSFLNNYEVTASRRASKFLINFEEAKLKLEFDLTNFPKELLLNLSKVNRLKNVIELRFNGVDFSKDRLVWENTEAKKEWYDISPMWDGDFYDGRFHRLFSYRNTILGATGGEYFERSEEICFPIMDRLAAIFQYIDNLLGTERSLVGKKIWVSDSLKLPDDLLICEVPSKSHVVIDNTPTYLLRPVSSLWQESHSSTILDQLKSEFLSIAVALSLWHEPFTREDERAWIDEIFGKPLSNVSAIEYLDKLNEFANIYLEKLDRVAPIISTANSQELIEELIEFLALPFWKNRWFLYELWTLVSTLNIAQRISPVELKIAEQGNVLEWNLPGGLASEPVATFGIGNNRICCWTQRKTYHPGTGAGLEPDLRFTSSAPEYHDLIIIENKDRLSAQKGNLSEILDRYVGGTCAESIWLINYEKFPDSAKALEQDWPERNVHIVSNFKPANLPIDFETEIESCFRRYLVVPAIVNDNDLLFLPKEPLTTSKIEITLSWTNLPKDLDLHAWVDSSGVQEHFFYGNMERDPYFKLDNDIREGGGKETFSINNAEFESILIAVHNYSGEVQLNQSDAVVNIWFNGRNIVLTVPRIAGEKWWSVMCLRNSGKEIDILQNFNHDSPNDV